MANLTKPNPKPGILSLKLTDCIVAYKNYLKDCKFDVIQLGNTKLVAVRNEDKSIIEINLECVSSNETRVAISQYS